MERSFNTTGPCFPDEHYMLPPEGRLGRVMELIQRGKVFTLQGSRWTGKTTSAQWLTDHYNRGAQLCAVCVDLQSARDQPDPAKAFATVLSMLDMAVPQALSDVGIPEDRARFLDVPDTAVARYLQDLSARAPRPLVVFFDEADCLVGPAMISLLTQLRSAYLSRRRAPFPQSVVLVGQRNVGDHAMTQEDRTKGGSSGSAPTFNISAEPTSIGPFTEPEVAELCAQHTTATGQRFEPEATTRIHELSQGNPWLVNTLADQIVDRDVRDRSVHVTTAHVNAAKETLIVERRAHIGSLIDELHDPRVRRLLAPMLAGNHVTASTLHDDVAHAIGLGILRIHAGQIEIANPISREVLQRALTSGG